MCKFEVNRDRRTRCTNSWSNLTLKCIANTFVKVDARIEENCRRTISAGILPQSFSCKKLSYQKHTANTVRNTRRTTCCGPKLTGPKFGHGMRDYLHVCREFGKSWGLAAKVETPLTFSGVSYLEANYK